MVTTHVYSGPTLSPEEIRARHPAMCVHPPVRHGDLLALETRPGDVVVIIDGLYHQHAPVRHKEILHLIDQGVHVVGCSSMGALRGAELADCGMVGHGTVFDMYRSGVIDADDEVAVTHHLEGGFAARSVPLVNIRHAVAEMSRAGVLSAQEAELVVQTARSLHYSERSWRMLHHRLQVRTDAVVRAQQFLEAHPEVGDVKRKDAWETLEGLDRIVAEAWRGEVPDGWHNPHLYDWLPEFSGAGHGDDRVSDADVVRYQQLHRPDFPHRWREFVLDRLRTPGPDGDRGPVPDADLAREVFASAGALDQVLAGPNPYLSHQESLELTEDERLLRTLVRSYVPPRGLHDVLDEFAQPPDVDRIRTRVREARRTNDRALWHGKVRLVERLSVRRIQEHVAALWSVDSSPESLALAARDRGWSDPDDAIATARAYFLSHTEEGGRAALRWEAR